MGIIDLGGIFMTVGERIKYLRKKWSMSQEDLAKKLGVTKATIQKYENGQIKNLRAENIRKLSEVFAVGPVFFVFDDVPDYVHGKMDELLIAHYGSWFEAFLENISKMNPEGKHMLRVYAEDISSLDKYRLNKYKSIRRDGEK